MIPFYTALFARVTPSRRVLTLQLNAFVLGFDAFGDLLQPSGGSAGAAGYQAGGPKPSPAASNKVLTGDLDSSLASLAMNLTINKSQQPKYKIYLFSCLLFFTNLTFCLLF